MVHVKYMILVVDILRTNEIDHSHIINSVV